MKKKIDNELFAEIYICSGKGKFLTPKRILLLEAIDVYGSIAQAAKTLPMSYKSAWDSVQEMNEYASQKLVITDKQNNGSSLTELGRFVINMYYGIQKACNYGVMHMGDTIF